MLAIGCGMVVGKTVIHSMILSRFLRLKMFRADQVTYALTRTHTHAHTHSFTHTRTHIHTYIYIYIVVCVYTYICIYMYAYVYVIGGAFNSCSKVSQILVKA
jgi:hypothetical protein